MASGSGGSGILGVLVGALIVLLVAGVVLQYTGVVNLAPGDKVDVDINVPAPKQ